MNRTQRTKAIYDRIPDVKCKGLCQAYCGPILMQTYEWDAIKARVGTIPPIGADLKCPLLQSDGKCSVYDIRPLVCRLWGAIPEMPCPFGCEPTLTSDEGSELVVQINGISQVSKESVKMVEKATRMHRFTRGDRVI